MRALTLPTAIVLAGICPVGSLAAQQDPAALAAQCDQLASMPNPPMSVEACRAMAQSAAAMQHALGQPGGERPGDEAMTCADIEAELKTIEGVGVEPQTSSEAAAAGGELQAELDRAKRGRRARSTPDPAMAAAQERTMSANAAVLQDLAGDMQANPRFGRLVRLGNDRQCRIGGQQR